MEQKDSTKRIRDVFHVGLVDEVSFSGSMELPQMINPLKMDKPPRLIRFSDCIGNKDKEAAVHFYEYDYKFERIWNAPDRYLPILSSYAAVISPDFSMYRNMPLVMQAWNTYRNRAIGRWLQNNGVNVIPNVRWGDERTHDFCFDGVSQNGIVAIGTHGCIRSTEDKRFFLEGLKEMLKRLSPRTIVVYGSAPEAIFSCCLDSGIEIWQYDSAISLSHRKGAC